MIGSRQSVGWSAALACSWALIALGAPHAQVTHIVADSPTSPDRSTATIVTQATRRLTNISGGTVAGKNLFHSFSDFSLAAGATAQWIYLNPQGTGPATGGAGIANVINRVTGGVVSSISGTMVVNTTAGDATALPKANFFFINPAGIVFGAGAQVSVPGAAYFSTAQELRFGPGEMVFSAVDPHSTLSTASPVSFGFFGSVADLTVSGQGLNNGAGSLSLSGADLTLTDPTIHVDNLSLFAVGSQAFDLPVSGGLAAGSAPSGTLIISAGNVIAAPSATAQGDVLIGAGDLQNSGQISSGGRQANAGTITIIASTSVDNLPGASINANSVISGDAGSVIITTGRLYNAPRDQQNNLTFGSISAASTGSGQAGQIIINATSTVNGGDISIHTQGNCVTGCTAGMIDITGATLVNQGGILAGTSGLTNGGEIVIDTTSSIENFAGGSIHSPTSGGGAAGAIVLTTNTLTNDRSGDISTSSDAATSGAAGTVAIQASRIQNDGTIQSDTNGTNPAGNILITTTGTAAGCATNCIANTGTISSTAKAGSSGPAGSITISTDVLSNQAGAHPGQNPGLISSSAAVGSNGAAGSVTIAANQIVNGAPAGSSAAITTSGYNGPNAGNGLPSPGQVTITDVNGDGGGDLENGGTIAASTAGSANAGNVSIAMTTVNNFGAISTDSSAVGAAGQVTITTVPTGGALDAVTNTGMISSTSDGGTGAAGSIAITTDTLTNIAGGGGIQSASVGGIGGAAGQISIAARSTVNSANISVNTDSTCPQGCPANGSTSNISITGGSLDNSGHIRAATTGAAAAGGVDINVQSFVNRTGGVIQSQTKAGGAAGAVNIVTSSFTNQQTGVITTLADTGSAGAAGMINIQAASVRNDGFINSNAYGAGPAGDITVTTSGSGAGCATNCVMNTGTLASTSQSGSSGDAGTVKISTDMLTNGPGVDTTLNPGSINSSAFGGSSGSAGDIFIDTLKLNNNGNIATESHYQNIKLVAVHTGEICINCDAGGRAGEIDNNGLISASTFGFHDGGTVDLNGTGITNIGDIESSAYGHGAAGDVSISATNLDNAGLISSNTGVAGKTTSIGAAGKVTISAAEVTNTGTISTDTFDTGAAGDVTIVTAGSGAGCATNCVINTGTISSTSQAGSVAAAGNVQITTDTLANFAPGVISSSAAGPAAALPGSTGAAGQVTILATNILNGAVQIDSMSGAVSVVTPGGAISTNAYDGGVSSTAGQISILLSPSNSPKDAPAPAATFVNTGAVSSDTAGTSAAGSVTIAARAVTNTGQISSQAQAGSVGAPGVVAIAADTLLNGATGTIATNAMGGTSPNSQLGTILLTALTPMAGDLHNSGAITSSTSGVDNAGSIGITLASVENDAGAQINSNTGSGTNPHATGSAGKVTIQGSSLINAGAIATDTFGSGPAGDISIATTTVVNTGVISSGAAAGSAGNAGSITIDTDSLSNFGMLAEISSSADVGSAGEAGSITVTAADIFNGAATVGQVPMSPTVDPQGGPVVATQQGGSIRTDAYNGPQSTGGQILLRGGSGGGLTNTGEISATTKGAARAGAVKIAVPSIINTGTITTAATAGSGGAGDITLVTNRLIDAGGGKITSNAETGSSGNAGSVTISNDPSTLLTTLNISLDNYQGLAASLAPTNNITIEGQGSEISSASKDSGSPGRIVTVANQVYLLNGGQIDTDTSSGVAGDIYLLFKPGLTFPQSVLSLSGDASQGPAPPIDIGVITTKSSGPTQASSGGKIFVYAPYALIQTGSLIQATGGSPNAQVFLSAGADIASTDRFNSIDVSGLYVNTGIVDLSGASKVESPTFVDAEKVLKGQCPSQAAQGETSRLTNELRGPYGGTFERLSLVAEGSARGSASSSCDR